MDKLQNVGAVTAPAPIEKRQVDQASPERPATAPRENPHIAPESGEKQAPVSLTREQLAETTARLQEALAESRPEVRNKTADSDFQIACHHFSIDEDRSSAGGFSQVYMVLVGIMVVYMVASNNVFSQFFDKILLRHGGMVGIRSHKADLIICDAGSMELLKHKGQYLPGRGGTC